MISTDVTKLATETNGCAQHAQLLATTASNCQLVDHVRGTINLTIDQTSDCVWVRGGYGIKLWYASASGDNPVI